MQNSTTLDRLLSRFNGREMVPLGETAPIISKTADAIYKIRQRGKLPFPVVPFPGAVLVRLIDLANWIDNATEPVEPVSGDTVQYAPVAPVTAGRPSNAERAAAAKLGLTVSEYRRARAGASQ